MNDMRFPRFAILLVLGFTWVAGVEELMLQVLISLSGLRGAFLFSEHLGTHSPLMFNTFSMSLMWCPRAIVDQKIIDDL